MYVCMRYLAFTAFGGSLFFLWVIEKVSQLHSSSAWFRFRILEVSYGMQMALSQTACGGDETFFSKGETEDP